VKSRMWLGTSFLVVLLGCGGGGGSGGGAPSTATNDSVAQNPVMAVADLDGSGTPTTLLIDTSQPSGSRVLDVVTTDAQGNLIETGSSPSAEAAANAVVNAGSVSQTTTLPFGNAGTVVAQAGQ